MSKEIVRGTTPTIRYKANTVNVSEVSVAYLDVMQFGTAKIEKDLTSATVDTDNQTIAWKLGQSDTLNLSVGQPAVIHCKVKLDDDTVFEAKDITVTVGKTGKNEVI